MTLTMADSIYPQNLPAGFDAYLGYVDGAWPTYSTLKQMFPGKHIIGLTVTGATLDADGCDIENGDLTAVSGAAWLKSKLATKPALAPIAYCSVTSMAAVVSELAAIGVPRSSVLLLSAHYGWKSIDYADPANQHICGPDSCTLTDLPQDGTQWTDAAAGNGGSQIDTSLLTDSFFGAPPTTEGSMAIIVWGETKAYLLDGGRTHVINSDGQPDELLMYQQAGVPSAGGPEQPNNYRLTAAQEALFLADFPPGNPAVTVNVPPVTATVGPMTLAGTITPG